MKRNLYSVRDSEGDITWYDGVKIHREGAPAIIYTNGDKHWYYDNLPHRDDGPASEYANGDKMWFVHGKLHRLDGPAMDTAESKAWYVDDERLPCSTQEEFEKIMKLKVFW